MPRIPLAASPIAGIGTVNEASKHCSCACVVGVYKISWVLRREEEDPRAEELGGEERSERKGHKIERTESKAKEGKKQGKRGK